jgi:EmrB/QacA subfamily drug resistance transporter
MSRSDLSVRHRRGILAICCLGLLLISVDNTIVNVALPQLREELGASLQSLQWVVGGYVLVLGSCLLLAGSFADRFGRKRIFLAGVVAFTLFSALSAVAPNESLLIVFRSAQGAGGAMMTPAALAIIANSYTVPAERARAIGWWGAVSGIGIAIGPLVGGPLVDAFGWRAVFWINVPVGVITLSLGAAFIPESKARHPRALDPIGQLFVIGLFGFTAFAIIQFPTSGVAFDTVGATVLSIASLIALIRWETGRREPLVDLGAFRDPPFARSFLTALIAFFAFAGFLFANTFYLQDVIGITATQAGLITLPLALAIIVAGPVSGRLVAAGRSRLALTTGGLGITLAGVLLVSISELPVWFIGVPLLLIGAGFGLLNDPINVVAISDLPPARAGVGAGLMSSAKQFGQLLGVSVIGALVASAEIAPSPNTGSTPPSLLIMSATLICGGTAIAIIAASMRRTKSETPIDRPLPVAFLRDRRDMP